MSRTAVHLIDGNALGYASHLGTKLSTGSMPTQAIFGLIRTMRLLQVESPRSRKIVLWDGSAKWRKEINPAYKESRKRTAEQLKVREEYARQVPDMRRALTYLGIDQVLSPNCEADDLAATYVAVFRKRDLPVTMVTGDRDWLQLVREGVDWFDPIHDRYCNHENFAEFTGFRDPEQFVDAKALQGDPSDNIKGVGRIGEVGAKKLLAAYGRVGNFLRMYDLNRERMIDLPIDWIKFAENLDGRRDRFFENRKIMELKPNAPGVKDAQVTKGAQDFEAFRRLCEELAFLSILGQFDEWIRPFTTIRNAA